MWGQPPSAVRWAQPRLSRLHWSRAANNAAQDDNRDKAWTTRSADVERVPALLIRLPRDGKGCDEEYAECRSLTQLVPAEPAYN